MILYEYLITDKQKENESEIFVLLGNYCSTVVLFMFQACMFEYGSGFYKIKLVDSLPFVNILTPGITWETIIQEHSSVSGEFELRKS